MKEEQLTTLEVARRTGNLFVVGIWCLSCFWSLNVRKWGSVGTRAFFTESVVTFVLIAFLLATTFLPLDKFVMFLALHWFVLNYAMHNASTRKARRKGARVHSHDIGRSRFGHPIAEFVVGAIVGVAFLALQAPVFGFFILVSALATLLSIGIIEERDTLRSIQMEDSLIEQERMMEVYNARNKRGV